MKKLMIFVDWYLPGYKAGGQIQSCANLAAALKDDLDIYVVTSDRDLGDGKPYDGIRRDIWIESAYGYKMYYISPENMRYAVIKSVIKYVKPDSIYLNSMFSLHFTIMAIVAALYTPAPRSGVVLAPRGMLHEGALQFKKIKKQFFLKAFRLLRLQKRITFHATDSQEELDIRNIFGKSTPVVFVNDFPAMHVSPLILSLKEPGMLKVIFVSRISPKKNIHYLLDRLAEVKGDIYLTIIGPVEDEGYWKEAGNKIKRLGPNVVVEYKGAVPNDDLPAFYQSHHLFILPTHGENFGHVIFESLLNGRPVLISDQTPWKLLEEKGIGWSLPLSATEKFREAIEQALAWNQNDFEMYSKASWQFASNYIKGSSLRKEYLGLFNS